MTTTLATKAPSEFSFATSFDRFFDGKSTKKIREVLERREQPNFNDPHHSCDYNLFFGFFFDGTRNNYVQADPTKSHSNVARLYDCFPGQSVPGVLPRATDWQRNPEHYSHFFRVYVPGVASPFKQVNDSGEGRDAMLGAACGALGERRIIWALVQAINNVHRFFHKLPMLDSSETLAVVKRIVLNKDARHAMEDPGWRPQNGRTGANDVARTEFEKLLRQLHKMVAYHWCDERTGRPQKVDPGIVRKIYVSTFGFSRGATQARAFANWLLSLCRLDAHLRGKPGRLSLGGFDVQFDFLGLFDTVASVGLGNTLGNSIVGRVLDGHGAWADAEDSLRIPAGIKCLHLVAAHELRRSFPLDSISVKGILPDGCEEVVLPGVHSDVGGGYCPCEQGRGTSEQGDDMLSRIPLLMMYKAARLNGVPLKLELASAPAQARFALHTGTIDAFNAYIATCSVTSGPLHLIMREQARKQMEWRLIRRVAGKNPLQSTASFARATIFEQNDLHSAALEFEDEIRAFQEWLKAKGAGFRPAVQQAGFDNEHEAEWEEIATWWRSSQLTPAAVIAFFDNHVHDSRAWFKLIPGQPDNEKDVRTMLDAWVRQRQSARTRSEIGRTMRGRGNAMFQAQAQDGLNDEQRRAADEYARTGQIPRMRTSGREPFDSSWKSYGLSGRAGYLRYRKVYGGWDSELLSAVPERAADGTRAA